MVNQVAARIRILDLVVDDEANARSPRAPARGESASLLVHRRRYNLDTAIAVTGTSHRHSWYTTTSPLTSSTGIENPVLATVGMLNGAENDPG
jgi:hypothetical protein